MIVSITGPSGVGKTTLLHNLLRSLPHTSTLTSVTTRTPRPTDEPGEYEYVSEEEYARLSAAGELLWEVHPHGKHYGTRKALVDEALKSSAIYLPVLLISAVKALDDYATQVGARESIRSLYIWIEDEAELRKRFAARGDMPQEEIESRLAECRTWNGEAKASGVPFIYLNATKTPEEILAHALSALK